eukprot:TRINITY_DN55188_c0_g1_i1.p1 TRINITY_DN55188_c0_g1~~TRINITY_DN55188_c0_g1_i1.p1  ORF type:complete len:170 (+),score=25.74 TRINITY_DN55188_c0_g1_i1:61-510(+)
MLRSTSQLAVTAVAATAGVATLLWAVRSRSRRNLFVGEEVTPSAEKVRHVVMFRFKEGAPVAAIVAAFDELAVKLGNLRIVADYERGTQCSPEGLHKDLMHAFTLTFDNAALRNEYLPHPLHQAFVETWARPYVEDVCVFDYAIERLSV